MKWVALRAVSEKSKVYLEEARHQVPEGIELAIWLDESEDVSEAINTMLGVARGGWRSCY